MKKLLLLLLFKLFLLEGFAQTKLIKGRILDENDKPLAGTTINLKGTSVSTISQADGGFQISTDQAHPVLVISFVGYEQLEYGMNGQMDVTIRLKLINQSLNDVVVVGYGTQQKKDVTGAISRVKADEFIKRPLVKVEQACKALLPE